MPQEQFRQIKTAGDVTLGYKIIRQSKPAPTLVMLHGLASNHTRWSEFVEFTQLKTKWTLLRVDLRGHAHSMYRGRINRKIWSDDLDFILQQENIEKAVIVGHSLGGQLGIDFASRYPQRCHALILIDPVFPSILKGILGYARRLRWGVWLLVRLLWLIDRLGLGRKKFPVRDLRALDEQTREYLLDQPAGEIARLYMNPRIDLEFMPLANYLQDLFEVVRPTVAEETIKLPVRVLLSAGADFSNLSETEAMIARFPDVQIRKIHADHWPLTEKPDEVRKAIEFFCDSLYYN